MNKINLVLIYLVKCRYKNICLCWFLLFNLLTVKRLEMNEAKAFDK